MADNVELPGTGQIVASDDVSGRQYQLVKIVDGTLNGDEPVPGGANGLSINIQNKTALIGAKTCTVVTGDDTTAEEVLAANSDRRSALIFNNSDGTVYLGVDSGVSIANGVPLAIGQSMTDTTSVDAWWVIGNTDVTVDLRVIEVG